MEVIKHRKNKANQGNKKNLLLTPIYLPPNNLFKVNKFDNILVIPSCVGAFFMEIV